MQRVLGVAGLAVGIGTLGVLGLASAAPHLRPTRGAGRCSEAPPWERGSRCCLWSRDSRSAPGCASARSTWGCPPRPGRTGRSTWSKGAGISAVTAAIGGLAAVALVRRFPRTWWAPGAVLVVAYGVVTIWLYPIVIDPVFNKFDKLKPGQLRSEVLRLADRAGVDVGEVYRIDASRRTSAANAYVIGLGHSKRVVLYDNLIDKFPRDEVRVVVAHELGHQKHDDLLRGLAWLAIVAPAGTFLTQALAERFARRDLGTPGGAAGDRAGRRRWRDWGSASRRTPCRGPWRPVPTRLRSSSRATRPTSSTSSAASRYATSRIRTRRGSSTSCSTPTRRTRSGSGSERPSAPSSLAQPVSRKALIERVVRELASYERPSASDGERRAADWLEGEFRAAGCRVRVEEERAHGGYWWPLGLLNAASALAALLGRRVATVVGAVAAAAVYDDVSGRRLWFRRLLPHRPTWNVVAEAGDPHADSHRRLHRPPRRRTQRPCVSPRAAAHRNEAGADAAREGESEHPDHLRNLPRAAAACVVGPARAALAQGQRAHLRRSARRRRWRISAQAASCRARTTT